MSGDPERLLSAGSHADPLERELLGSVRQVGPPDGAKDRAWRGIAAQIAVVAAVGTAASGSAAAASKGTAGALASWAISTKVAVAVAASGLAMGGGYLMLNEPAAPAAVAGAPAVRSAPAPAEPTPPPAQKAQEPPAAAVEVEQAPHRREPPRQDLLRAESSLLTDARAQLRAGNVAAAQASLERLQTQFPRGVLSQEREVLAIELLHARGNIEGASRRARAFMKAHPSSPHSAKLSRFVD